MDFSTGQQRWGNSALLFYFFKRRIIMKFIEDLKFVYHLSKWEKAYKKGDEAGMTKHGAIVNFMCKA